MYYGLGVVIRKEDDANYLAEILIGHVVDVVNDLALRRRYSSMSLSNITT